MRPTDTPTPPQLGLLQGLARGGRLIQDSVRWTARFADSGETFSMATLFACTGRVWVAIAFGHETSFTSISDLGREAIKRAEADHA